MYSLSTPNSLPSLHYRTLSKESPPSSARSSLTSILPSGEAVSKAFLFNIESNLISIAIEFYLNAYLRGAFRYAKVFSSEGEITENQSIADLTLDFEEFQKFFFALRQYFLYCQVSNKQNTLGQYIFGPF